MKTTRRKTRTPEEIVKAMYAGQTPNGISYTQLIEAGWEAGQVGAVELNGVNYEQYPLSGGGYVVVEWDADGNVCVG